jgi:signal transduction histidine kinase
MMHMVAGVGALAMGGGILIRGPRDARDRLFALLCAALALWNVAFLGRQHSDLWRPIYLFGSCAAAPLVLQFVLALTAASRPTRRRYLMPAYLLASAVWLSSWLPVPHWNLLAIVVLGGTLVAGLRVLARHAVSRPPGAERRAMLYVLGGGIVAVIGGMSDFLSRSWFAVTQLGPLAVLLFLLIVCVVLVRFRFLDVDLFLARFVALIAGAATVGLALFGVVRFVDDGFLTLFLASVVLLALAVPVGRIVLSKSRMLLAPGDPLSRALMEISRRIPQAATAEQMWDTIEDRRRALVGDTRIDVYVRRSHQEHFHLYHRSSGLEDLDASPLHRYSVLPRVLEKRRLPLVLPQLVQERLESRGIEQRRLSKLIDELDRAQVKLVAPFFFHDRVGGWIALGGDLPDESLTPGVATELLAVCNQASAALDRLEATEMARRKEALAAVGELAAGLAHEVRNPVAAIHGAAQAMESATDDEQRREMLEVIAEESRRLDRVVGQFLSYARPGSPRSEPVNLADLALQVLKTLELAGKRLRGELHVARPVPPALGDPDLLRRVFENLIRNAWEATGDDRHLRIDLHELPKNRVAIRFEDDGPGIPPSEVSRLFEPFYTAKPGGTGLGLSLAHRIVDAHRGEISVEGRPGIGAAFTVILPAAVEPKPETP